MSAPPSPTGARPVAVETQNVSKHFGATRALDRVSLTAHQGQVLGVLGHNGAGKSTLLRIMTTLLEPDPGSAVRIAGIDALTHGRRARALLGSAGQSSSLDPLLTGRQNLRLVAALRGMSSARTRAAADEALHDVDLVESADRPVETYSGGMARRLDLASALIGSPPVLFLDEPTTGIDPEARRTIWRRIAAVAGAGTCVLLTTQYLEEAERLADDIVILRDGRVVARGTPESLKQRVSTERMDLTFDTPSGRAIAQAALASSFDLVETGQSSLSVVVPRGTEDVRLLLRGVAALDAPLLEARRRTASLDDVFFHTLALEQTRGAP